MITHPHRLYRTLIKFIILVVTGGFISSAFPAPTILGSKHDFTGLNRRAGVTAMGGLAFSDYGKSCVYCHVPSNPAPLSKAAAHGRIRGWNRYTPAAGAYDLYDFRTINNKVRTPSPISLLCLSCHDGTMGVDMSVFKPNSWKTPEDAALHLRINGGNNLMYCGKCHNGKVAHNIEIKDLGTGLRNTHPISMTYAGLTHKDEDFRPPDGPYGFDNGVKLYDGKVECATCHNVHNPNVTLFARVGVDRLCETCHIK